MLNFTEPSQFFNPEIRYYWDNFNFILANRKISVQIVNRD